jgi:hypothetical protein
MKKLIFLASLLFVFGTNAENARLNFVLLTTTNSTTIIQWKLISLPTVSEALTTCDGGTGSVPIVCYSGPVYQLGASGLGTNSMIIEASTNLINWQPFPAPGFQLTMYATSNPFLNIPEDQALFFRGVCVKP